MTIYAVVYSNYEPAEVDSLWEAEEDADRRCEQCNAKSDTGMWKVVPWTVNPKGTTWSEDE
jgi:hypothetical protein